MSKDKPDPVQIVNPQAAAGQQATYNRDAALEQRALNMVDQYTPDGSTTYEATGGERVSGIPDYKITQTLSPEQAALKNLTTQAATKYGQIGNTQLDAVRGSFEQPFNVSNILYGGTGGATLGTAGPQINEQVRQDAIDAIIARSQPQADRDRGALETSLANQGFVTGTAAYNDAMGEHTSARNDFYLGADVAGGNEMARTYGLEASARDRAINEALMDRTQPLAELSSFMTGAQPTGPQFLPTPQGQIAPADYMGAAYGSANQANQRAAMQNQANAAAMQGLAGIGGAGLTFGGLTYGGKGWGR